MSKVMVANFDGKEFWAGCVSLIDGVVEEVHSYEEAAYYDFHHSMYFSKEALDKMNDMSTFFSIRKDGIYIDEICRNQNKVPKWIKSKILEQISNIHEVEKPNKITFDMIED